MAGYEPRHAGADRGGARAWPMPVSICRRSRQRPTRSAIWVDGQRAWPTRWASTRSAGIAWAKATRQCHRGPRGAPAAAQRRRRLPGQMDRAHAGPARPLHPVLRRRRALPPWTALRADYGLRAGDSTIAVVGIEATMNMNTHSNSRWTNCCVVFAANSMVHPPSNEYVQGGELADDQSGTRGHLHPRRPRQGGRCSSGCGN